MSLKSYHSSVLCLSTVDAVLCVVRGVFGEGGRSAVIGVICEM